MIKGSKMTAEQRSRISAGLRGNQFRKGIPFTQAEKDRLSQIIMLEYAVGDRTPNLNPQNLAAFNAAIKSGERVHPRVNPKRDAEIAAHYATTGSQKATGKVFGLTGWAVTHALRRHERRTQS
jgi:hypothetical protein